MEKTFLRSIREKSGLTLKELSEKTKISIATLCLIENGKVTPRPITIKRLADVYNVDYNDLYEKVEKGE